MFNILRSLLTVSTGALYHFAIPPVMWEGSNFAHTLAKSCYHPFVIIIIIAIPVSAHLFLQPNFS